MCNTVDQERLEENNEAAEERTRKRRLIIAELDLSLISLNSQAEETERKGEIEKEEKDEED